MESSTVEDKFYKTPIANMKKIEDEGPETKDESGSNCTPVTGFEFATRNGVEKKKEENGSDSQKKEEQIQIAKVESKHSKESSNEPGFVTKKNNDENVDKGFLSRDEAIKLSTNASGTSQPRLSTRPGNSLLIKHGETDSTCKEEETDKIQDKNVEKVSSATTINAKVFEPEESDQGLRTIPTPKYAECQNLSGKQTVTPTFGSKDPVVKKKVYNQYREMLRKYTQSSRL